MVQVLGFFKLHSVFHQKAKYAEDLHTPVSLRSASVMSCRPPSSSRLLDARLQLVPFDVATESPDWIVAEAAQKAESCKTKLARSELFHPWCRIPLRPSKLHKATMASLSPQDRALAPVVAQASTRKPTTQPPLRLQPTNLSCRRSFLRIRHSNRRLAHGTPGYGRIVAFSHAWGPAGRRGRWEHQLDMGRVAAYNTPTTAGGRQRERS